MNTEIVAKKITLLVMGLVELITKVSICLHNYLPLTDNAGYQPSRFIDREVDDCRIIPGDLTRETNGDANVVQIERIGGNRYTFEAGGQGTIYELLQRQGQCTLAI